LVVHIRLQKEIELYLGWIRKPIHQIYTHSMFTSTPSNNYSKGLIK